MASLDGLRNSIVRAQKNSLEEGAGCSYGTNRKTARAEHTQTAAPSTALPNSRAYFLPPRSLFYIKLQYAIASRGLSSCYEIYHVRQVDRNVGAPKGLG